MVKHYFLSKSSNSGHRSSLRMTKWYFRVTGNKSIIKIVASYFIFVTEYMRQIVCLCYIIRKLSVNFSRQPVRISSKCGTWFSTSFTTSSGEPAVRPDSCFCPTAFALIPSMNHFYSFFQDTVRQCCAA